MRAVTRTQGEYAKTDPTDALLLTAFAEAVRCVPTLVFHGNKVTLSCAPTASGRVRGNEHNGCVGCDAACARDACARGRVITLTTDMPASWLPQFDPRQDTGNCAVSELLLSLGAGTRCGTATGGSMAAAVKTTRSGVCDNGHGRNGNIPLGANFSNLAEPWAHRNPARRCPDPTWRGKRSPEHRPEARAFLLAHDPERKASEDGPGGGDEKTHRCARPCAQRACLSFPTLTERLPTGAHPATLDTRAEAGEASSTTLSRQTDRCSIGGRVRAGPR